MPEQRSVDGAREGDGLDDHGGRAQDGDPEGHAGGPAQSGNPSGQLGVDQTGAHRPGGAGAQRLNLVSFTWMARPMRPSARASRATSASSQVAAVRTPSGRSATTAVRTGSTGSSGPGVTVNDTTVASALDGAGSATGTTSVAAAASAARSATQNARLGGRRGGAPHGQSRLGEHARHRGDQPQLVGPLAEQAADRHGREQHEVVEGTAGEGHATGHGGRTRQVEPELTLLDAHGRREARVHLGQLEVAEGSADPGLGGPAEHRHGRPRVQPAACGEGDRARASAGRHGGTASGPARRRRARARPAAQIRRAEAWSTVHWLACQRL